MKQQRPRIGSRRAWIELAAIAALVIIGQQLCNVVYAISGAGEAPWPVRLLCGLVLSIPLSDRLTAWLCADDASQRRRPG